MVSRWQSYIRFDRPEIRTSDQCVTARPPGRSVFDFKSLFGPILVGPFTTLLQTMALEEDSGVASWPRGTKFLPQRGLIRCGTSVLSVGQNGSWNTGN